MTLKRKCGILYPITDKYPITDIEQEGVSLLIIAEKPDVARQFAEALGCSPSAGIYTDGGSIEITNCLGHLYEPYEPEDYDERFKPWTCVPVIPEKFEYATPQKKSRQAALVKSLLKKHRHDEILIATDADREGEIIARECLIDAGITDLSRARRFWVSQALTKDVIKEGIKNALPLSDEFYDKLSRQGFARQHSDWLTGYNFTRYISNASNRKLPVGRVQTAVLSAIDDRCRQIENFKSEKYFEHTGVFTDQNGKSCKGILFEGEGRTQFPDGERHEKLQALAGSRAALEKLDSEDKAMQPPQLYNLNEIQKDAFKKFGYAAEKTLSVIQRLYEERKCVSYPRTPSRVMGSQNVELCASIYSRLAETHPDMKRILQESDISIGNKRVFNDAKLEAHHALIPLAELPPDASEDERNIYSLILSRFSIAFAMPFTYEKQTAIVAAGTNSFRISGRKTKEAGWRKFQSEPEDNSGKDEEQDLSGIDWATLRLEKIDTAEKWTRPPKYFNEASILAFMENPKGEDEDKARLVGLGTPATRHTFIPKLLDCGYIETSKKNIVVTTLGRSLLDAVRKSGIKSIADISETTNWEKQLDSDPDAFETRIREYVRESVATPFKAEIRGDSDISCPKCGKEMRSSDKGWYCSGYRDGCDFKIWKTIAGAKLTEKDAAALCSNGKTPEKKFCSKAGKKFTARLFLNQDHEVRFEFQSKSEETAAVCPKCGRPIRKGDKSWYCSGYRDGCDFKIWKTIAGAKLTEKDAESLLSGKRTPEKSLTSKTGKKFTAKLFMDDAFDIKFDFGDKKQNTP